MYAVKLAAIACIPLAAGLIRDWRDFSNAVLAALALTLAAFAAASTLVASHDAVSVAALVVLSLLVASGPLIVSAYLLHNGLGFTSREPPSLPRVPAAVLGFAILAVAILAVLTQPFRSDQLGITTTVVMLLYGYVSAMFGWFALASRLRARLRPRPDGDVVVVLGSGLGPGGQVTPLLASRLDRGQQEYEALAAQGRDPILVVSGGKGRRDQASEAEAMAQYLLGRGFPASALVREEESRSTEENLANTAALIGKLRPGASYVIVTSDFHVLRTSVLADRLDLPAQVTGAPWTRSHRWPSATVREFGATFLGYKPNLAVCLLIVAVPLTYLALRQLARQRRRTLSATSVTPAPPATSGA